MTYDPTNSGSYAGLCSIVVVVVNMQSHCCKKNRWRIGLNEQICLNEYWWWYSHSFFANLWYRIPIFELAAVDARSYWWMVIERAVASVAARSTVTGRVHPCRMSTMSSLSVRMRSGLVVDVSGWLFVGGSWPTAVTCWTATRSLCYSAVSSFNYD